MTPDDKEYLLSVINERDRRVMAELDAVRGSIAERDRWIESALQSIRDSVVAVKEGIGIALSASKEAVAKAETAAEKRFEGVNEFRAQLGDQQRTLMPRQEAEVILNQIRSDINALKNREQVTTGRKEGSMQGWQLAVGVVLFVVALVSAIIAFLPKGKP